MTCIVTFGRAAPADRCASWAAMVGSTISGDHARSVAALSWTSCQFLNPQGIADHVRFSARRLSVSGP
jgi:hypothetical protein